MRKRLDWLKEIGESVAISLVIVFLIRAFLFQPFFVKGQSMENSFDNGDYLIVDEITPRIFPFRRGEVIVFRPPIDRKSFYIKRIIGLPGERVVIKDGHVEIFNHKWPKGLILDESSYLGKNTFTNGDIDIKLKKDELFVLGDNRLVSFDSRRWGPLKTKEVVGIVRLRAWPVKEFSLFRYNYNFQH